MMKISKKEFAALTLRDKIDVLYQLGTFVTNIRYYGYKVNLYLLSTFYVEVFYNHKKDLIEKIEFLPQNHSRHKFYSDQIKLPLDLVD
ncbi:hypothetical protein [Penaeicola halotolerans]|uniref:hypothetical protein n=1 Tax=Penaeicola halotolerans TaxID=2793196 RepID=UPI0021D32DC1|nr:hypothetical protein [Penaeicola halotolerans]